MILRDRFWLWGHPEGCFNNAWGNTKASRMTPMECCLFLGIRNTFMVPMGIPVNKRQYNKSFKTLRQVGWECFEAVHHPEMLDELIGMAAEFPNIGCAVLDDFKCEDRYKQYSLDVLKDLHRRLHATPVSRLDSWMVLYTHQFGIDPSEDAAFGPYMDCFDGIIMWTWEERDAVLIPEKYEIFKKLTPHNRRMFGCYLYNFGENKQATADSVLWQLDFYKEKLLTGEAEGVVFHTNAMADLDYPAFDAACGWMERNGDLTVPEI
jgi:hypothetical protein